MTARWRGYEHPELYKMINTGPGPAASDQQTVYWASLTDELAQIDADLHKALADLNARWEGSASDRANAGMTPLQAWASDAQTGTAVMRISTENQADYISSARAEMPQPVEVTTPAPSAWDVGAAGLSALTGNPGPAAAVAAQAIDHERQEAAQAAAAQKAVDTMNVYQTNSTWNAETLGTFVPPPDVVVSTPLPPGATGGEVGSWIAQPAAPGGTSGTTTSSFTTYAPGGGGGGGGLYAPGGSYLQPGGPTAPAGSPPPNLPSPTLPSPVGTGPGGYPPGGANTYPVPPAGSLPGRGPATTGLPPNSKPGTGGGPGPNARGGLPGTGGIPGPDGEARRPLGPGGPGSGGGPGGPEGPRASSQAGHGGLAAKGGLAGDGVSGRGGSGGLGGGRGGMTGGPMGAGARGRGEDDDEHFSPDYLLETTDVFGDNRVVSPAVIGEHTDPAAT